MSTIFAPLTPVQHSPVIAVRVSGVDVKKLFSLMRLTTTNDIARKAVHSQYISASNPKITDDTIFVYYPAPNSYTGEDVLELFFHGNPIIVHTVFTDMKQLGFRLAERGEFTKRAYINGKMTLSGAESVEALINAKTDDGIKVAFNARTGGLDNRINAIRSSLLASLSVVEAGIDFFEDYPDISEVMPAVHNAVIAITSLLDGYTRNKCAINGVNIAIIGKPNAGKSSVFNALLQADRAIVSEEAGTTRDTITEQLSAGGFAMHVTDTAGVRETTSVAEAAGVQRTLKAVETADLILYMLDLSTLSTSIIDPEIITKIKGKPYITVGTKSDIARDSDSFCDIAVSINSPESIEQLRTLIIEQVAAVAPNTDDFGLIAERQKSICHDALEYLNSISSKDSLDIIAFNIRGAVAALGGIQGGDLSEETLDMIFGKFCIGK